MAGKGGRYLMFSLGEEYYGAEILKINEIIGVMDIVHVPQTPPAVKGIINLRGRIIPIVDLRIKFSMTEREYDEQTCIIIAEINHHGHHSLIGIVVDKVSEVVNIDSSNIEPPPEYGTDEEMNFLTGVGKVKDRVIILLDLEKIVNSQNLIHLTKPEAMPKEEAFEEIEMDFAEAK